MRRILETLKFLHNKKYFAFLSCFEILRGFVLTVGQAYGIIWISDGAFARDMNMLQKGIVTLVFSLLFATAMVVLIETLCTIILVKSRSNLRIGIMEAILGDRSMTNKSSGDTLYLINDNVREVTDLYTRIKFFIGSFGKTIGSVVVGFTLSWQLSLLMIGSGFIKILIDKKVINNLQQVSRNLKKLESTITTTLLEFINGSTFFRYYGSNKVMEKADSLYKEFYKINQEEAHINSNVDLIRQIFEFGTLILVLAIGSYMTIDGMLTIGALTAFIALHGNLINPYKFIGDFMKEYNRLYISYENVSKVVNGKNNENEESDSEIQFDTKDKFSVVVDHLSFGYNEDKEILKDVNFRADSGEVTYLVGRSGVGKTTIFKLVAGLAKPSHGKIYIQDERKNRYQISKKHLAYLRQTIFLFNGSIKENITLTDDRDIDVERMKEAAKKAGIYDFIMEYPEGFEHVIQDVGNTLSGGQKVRLALARIFYMDAPVILLDEAFASLDNNSIYLVQEYLKTLSSNNRCLLMISHRHEWIEENSKIVSL